MEYWFFFGATLALGAIVGSFLNVVIHRYPREESIVFPASRCPSCGAAIRPYDNIPILSYLILRGRCRSCRQSISVRYPLVELANGLFYAALFQRTGLTLGFIPLAAIVSMTIVLIYIDADIQILPDVIDLPGAAIGLLIGAMTLGVLVPDLMLSASLIDSLLGAALGSALLLAIAIGYKLLRQIEGMGLGDVKMMAMIGAVLGWQRVLPTLLIASIAGALGGLVAASQSERGLQVAIPFGVFLGLSTLTMMFFGNALWAWYTRALLT